MDLFPPLEPHATGMLAVGDGHSVYWEVSGNPTGVPVLFVHGGPGAATAPPDRRYFAPAYSRIGLFDQRGCGLSTPHGAIHANTTAHLVADMEVLRRHLAVDRWLLFGGSWGSTLALAYGQAWPERMLGFVLRGIFLFRPRETQWFLHGMGTFFPEAARRFRDHVGAEDERLLQTYHRLLGDPDPAVHLPAARAWCAYEEACARLMPRTQPTDLDGSSALPLARLECHYMVHEGFLGPNQLLEGMAAINHLPAHLVQGRYDVVCPPVTADELACHWPAARLEMVAEAGHSAMEPALRRALVLAVRGFQARLG